MIKVSVIVPVYNVGQYIGECLDSLLNQTFQDFESLFIDDCGKDNSVSIIEDFLDNHPGFNGRIIRHEKNKGLSGARNTGLKEAVGEYVYFMDSDDRIPYDALEKLVIVAQSSAVDFVIGNYDVFGDAQMGSDLSMDGGRSEDVLRSYVAGKWYVMAWNKLCRRQFLLDNQLFFEEGYIHEDQIWSFKVACKASSAYVVPDITYDYRVRQSSIMTGMGIQKDAATYVKVYEAISRFIIDEHLEANPLVYSLFEGKRSGILYSLLEKNENKVYTETYESFCVQVYLSPLKAFRKGMIDVKTLLRDIHYVFPKGIGRLYKKLFYMTYYKLLRHPVEGLVWK